MVHRLHIFAILVLVALVLCMALQPQQASGQSASTQPAPTEEYLVKAACMLNFAQFIEWPSSAFPTPQSPIIVGVLGDDPFGSALEQTFQDETVGGRKIAVIRSHQIEDMKSCQLLFICKSEKDHVNDILQSMNDKSVVTIGEMDKLAQRGGIIHFYLSGSKIRFEINSEAAENKKLKINSQLLKRARIVSSD